MGPGKQSLVPMLFDVYRPIKELSTFKLETRSGYKTWEQFEGMLGETFCKKFPPAPPSKTPKYCNHFQLRTDGGRR